jgi:hypothetical protein
MGETEKMPSLSSSSLDPFPFLSLPIDLSLYVYQFLLPCGQDIFMRFPRPKHSGHNRCQTIVPPKTRSIAILCTSKAIHTEALSILYNENTFYFDTPMAPWRRTIQLPEYLLGRRIFGGKCAVFEEAYR